MSICNGKHLLPYIKADLNEWRENVPKALPNTELTIPADRGAIALPMVLLFEPLELIVTFYRKTPPLK